MNLKKLLRPIIIRLNEWAGIKTTIWYDTRDQNDGTIKLEQIRFKIENHKIIVKIPHNYIPGEEGIRELLWDELKGTIPRAAMDIHIKQIRLPLSILNIATGRIRFLVPEKVLP